MKDWLEAAAAEKEGRNECAFVIGNGSITESERNASTTMVGVLGQMERPLVRDGLLGEEMRLGMEREMGDKDDDGRRMAA